MKHNPSHRRMLHGALAAGMALAACLPAFAQQERDDSRPGTQQARRESGERQYRRAEQPQRAQAAQARPAERTPATVRER
ncbi:MAG: hypothetical protein KIS72_05460, partial [Luteimonas sp.]|nr:hypothetical protein [Luteimonas sp.]